jgi:ATP-dependent Zn protease
VSFDRANSAKKQTTHMNFSFKLSSNSNSEIFFQSSSFKDETDEKNSTKQINKISKSSQKSTFFSMMMMMIMMMITMITSMIVVEREISKTLL